VLAVFSDPNCPYCKQLEPELDKLKDVTIYTFIYPLKPQSIVVSRQVWCAPNQSYSWEKLIQQGVKPIAASCANPIDR
ncbi:thioredoxin fold domain-containing protein, partial [Klebsiella pneumoniae]|nr:thioredoxin fold domain-containing protein [Klebsiella pneumoniae]